ncbi:MULTISPECIES: hypothetical protein [unclassified Coleofasciculus]|uniref:hypothetical protein n=1 Tax=unclassified Coleofasciculus TaxID=2692782 RepID=UPI00188191C9|nr:MULTISPECIES: hypothetical protein [unclassified Coleofasciculus]MBE9128814.1 hypothetical protein [Coleofasciculus sp. LEGE 07081]MBE9149449.1 hypothetical protein [Coleofasciculus sp. LEGE 07092]
MNLEEESGDLLVKLQTLKADIGALAKSYEEDSLALLALLRTLEQSHRDIRENLFQGSLPRNRRVFYALLKDIEESGGWPYIERMKLRTILESFSKPEASNGEPESDRYLD